MAFCINKVKYKYVPSSYVLGQMTSIWHCFVGSKCCPHNDPTLMGWSYDDCMLIFIFKIAIQSKPKMEGSGNVSNAKQQVDMTRK